jgi:hypothetical protein
LWKREAKKRIHRGRKIKRRREREEEIEDEEMGKRKEGKLQSGKGGKEKTIKNGNKKIKAAKKMKINNIGETRTNIKEQWHHLLYKYFL